MRVLCGHFRSLADEEPVAVLEVLPTPKQIARLSEGYCPVPQVHDDGAELHLIRRGQWGLCSWRSSEFQGYCGWRIEGVEA